MKIDRKKWLSCIGKGWHNLLNETFDKMEQVAYDRYADLCITDVREKYGALQITYEIQGNYLKMTNGEKQLYDALDELVSEAEVKSKTICEYCGVQGKLRTHHACGKTLCDECNNARDHGNGKKVWTEKNITKYLDRCEGLMNDFKDGILPTKAKLNKLIRETDQLHQKQLLKPVLYEMIKGHLMEVKEQMDQ